MKFLFAKHTVILPMPRQNVRWTSSFLNKGERSSEISNECILFFMHKRQSLKLLLLGIEKKKKMHLPDQHRGFSGDSAVKNVPAIQETQRPWIQSLGWEDSLEEEMATDSSIFAGKIPGREEPSALQPIASQSQRWLSTKAPGQ